MTSRDLVCLGALVFLPAVAFAQDGRWKLGGDGSCTFDPWDGGPNQCEPATPPEVVRQQLIDTVTELAAGVEAICDDAAPDDEGRWACSDTVKDIAAAVVVRTGGSNVYLDAVASYCVAADLYYDSMRLLEMWGTAAHERLMEWFWLKRGELLNVIFAATQAAVVW